MPSSDRMLSKRKKHTTASSQSAQNISKINGQDKSCHSLPAMLPMLKGEHEQRRKAMYKEGLAVKPAKCFNFITAGKKKKEEKEEVEKGAILLANYTYPTADMNKITSV